MDLLISFPIPNLDDACIRTKSSKQILLCLENRFSLIYRLSFYNRIFLCQRKTEELRFVAVSFSPRRNARGYTVDQPVLRFITLRYTVIHTFPTSELIVNKIKLLEELQRQTQLYSLIYTNV